MYVEVGISPGLFPVVQVTDVEVAAVASHTIPSNKIVYFDGSADSWVPVKVTESPPTTVPCLGFAGDCSYEINANGLAAIIR